MGCTSQLPVIEHGAVAPVGVEGEIGGAAYGSVTLRR